MTHHLLFQVHGNANHGPSVAESVENLLVYFTSLIDKAPLEIFAEWFPGISQLQNMHPVFVHFPIAFLTAFFMLDIIGAFGFKPQWRAAASWFLYLGALFAIVTVGAGIVASSSVAHGHNVHDIMERHEFLGLTVLVLSSILSIWRLNLQALVCDTPNSIFMLLSTVLFVAVLLTADLGGLMVYRYGVSVAGVPQESHDHQQAETQNSDSSQHSEHGSHDDHSGHGDHED